MSGVGSEATAGQRTQQDGKDSYHASRETTRTHAANANTADTAARLAAATVPAQHTLQLSVQVERRASATFFVPHA